MPFHDCATHQAKTLLLGPTGRIFQQPWWDGEIWTKVAFGCLFSLNKRVSLGVDDENSDDEDLDLFRLAGHYVAFSDAISGGASGSVALVVIDLRNGHNHHRPRLASYPSDIELKDNGSVAWIGQEGFAQPPARSAGANDLGVFAEDSTGHHRLDTGKIGPTSLELNGSTLTWTKAGNTYSATLQ
jgi:hypothetical protein